MHEALVNGPRRQPPAPKTPQTLLTIVLLHLTVHSTSTQELVEYDIFCSEGGAHAFFPGTLVSGLVSSVRPYGAYITLDGGSGATGFLPRSQMSAEYVRRVDDVLRSGEIIKASKRAAVAHFPYACCTTADSSVQPYES